MVRESASPKEGVGNATGNDKLAGEGMFDQVAGSVMDAAGKAAYAVSALNRN